MVSQMGEAKRKPEPRRTKRSSGARAGDAFSTLKQVEQRAYEIYLARGGEHGHALEDWLQAERELRERQPESRAN